MASATCDRVCKKCKRATKHRWLTIGYWQCSVCAEANSVRHRHKHWCRYLAQKANSRKKEGSTTLTETHIMSLYENQEQKCALTGTPFDTSSEIARPSLDRIDSKRGYTTDNIQLVIFSVNRCKGDLSEVTFIKLCRLVSKYKQKACGL